jgi:hypothetical protein
MYRKFELIIVKRPQQLLTSLFYYAKGPALGTPDESRHSGRKIIPRIYSSGRGQRPGGRPCCMWFYYLDYFDCRTGFDSSVSSKLVVLIGILDRPMIYNVPYRYGLRESILFVLRQQK